MNMSEDNSGTAQGTSDVGAVGEDVESHQEVVSIDGEEVIEVGGDEIITRNAAADTIVFTSTNTTVEAGDGANTITGTSGNNLISAGIGADTITVTTGHNTIDAGSGINTITAMSGNNQITAGDGADTITLTSGNNKINAGGGINTIAATTGNNSITTGDGADTITVSTGNNTIHAGSGANTITASLGNNTITAGDGADTITTSGLAGGGNTIDAGNGANTVTTGAGNDTVTSGNGADTITTGAGDDTITVKGGIDTIAAGAGNDTLIADLSLATGVVSLSALAGTAAAGYAGNLSGLGIATFAGVENFEITSGDFNDTITTGDGTDVVRSGAGNDTVNLAGGNDEAIYTMAENTGASDVYQGGAGVDTLTLEFTEAEWLSVGVQADIANYIAFQAANTGVANSAVFQFTAFDLSVSEFEALNVIVDGVALDPNDAAVDDVADLNEDDTATQFASVLVNDDAAALAYSVTLISGPSEGVLTFNAGMEGAPDGSYSFDPNDDFEDLALGETRDVSFVYEVQDAFHGPRQATVTITVTGTNDAPVVEAIDGGSVTEDDADVTIDLLTGQTDVDNGAVLSAANISATDDLGNAVTFTDNGDGTISIDPAQYDALNDGQDRTVTIAYDVSDGIDSTATTATLVVEGVNDNEPPVANDDVLGATLSENQISSANIAVLDNSGIVDTSGGPYSESDTIQASLVQAGHIVSPFTGLDAASIQAALSSADVLVIPEQERGDLGNTLSAASSAAIRDFIADGGTLVVSHDDKNSLNEIFGFSLSQSRGGTSSLTSDAVGTTFEGGPATIPNINAMRGFLTSTLPTGSLTIYETGGVSTVAVIPFGDGQITTIGWDWFNAQPMGSHDSGWLDVLNRSISLTDVLETTDEDNAYTIAAAELLANDTDTDGDTLGISAVSAVSTLGATVILNGDGSVSYDPTSSTTLDEMAHGDTLEDSFTYTVSDGNGGFDTATVTLVATGTNDAPVITSDAVAASGAVVVAGFDDTGAIVAGVASATGTLKSSDVDNKSSATWSSDAAGTYGSFAIDPTTGAWTYTLDNTNTATDALADGQVETETFTVTVTDGFHATDTQNVTVTVAGSNDSPPPQLIWGAHAGANEGNTASAVGGDGDDTISFGGYAGYNNGSASADGGAGNDVITFGGQAGYTNGSASADGGAGNDIIDFGVQAGLRGSVIAQGGAGDDYISTGVWGSGSQGYISLDGGMGNDTIELKGSTAAFGIAIVMGGEGDDNISMGSNSAVWGGIASINGGAGNDKIIIGDSVGHSIQGHEITHPLATAFVGDGVIVDGGAGNDEITFGDKAGYSNGSVTADGGAGVDTIRFGIDAGSKGGSVSADGGAGNDTFIFGGGAENLTIDLGAGDRDVDSVTFLGSVSNATIDNWEVGRDVVSVQGRWTGHDDGTDTTFTNGSQEITFLEVTGIGTDVDIFFI
jgi:VCBS repeat-containing protein